MKTKLFAVALVAVSLASATQARAQVIYSTTGPSGIVAWSSVPVGAVCRITKGNTLKAITGTEAITFAASSFGRISGACYVGSIMRVDPSSVNAFGLTFSGTNASQCTVSGQMEQAEPFTGVLPTLIGAFSTSGVSFSSFPETANAALSAFLNFDAHTYFVNFTLVRPSGATCNPSVSLAFLEEIIL